MTFFKYKINMSYTQSCNISLFWESWAVGHINNSHSDNIVAKLMSVKSITFLLIESTRGRLSLTNSIKLIVDRTKSIIVRCPSHFFQHTVSSHMYPENPEGTR